MSLLGADYTAVPDSVSLSSGTIVRVRCFYTQSPVGGATGSDILRKLSEFGVPMNAQTSVPSFGVEISGSITREVTAGELRAMITAALGDFWLIWSVVTEPVEVRTGSGGTSPRTTLSLVSMAILGVTGLVFWLSIRKGL